ncbi:MAG: hypothetical protein ABIY52_19205 [Gemmatimonadaceae bacterium]
MTEPVEHPIVVPRTARYYTLGPTHGFPRELWFVVHGYGQLARRFIQDFAPLDDGTRLIVAPEALSRYYIDSIPERRKQKEPRVGATWMTREFRDAEMADYVSYLDKVAHEIRHQLSGASPRIVVVGFSQGAATVSRWLAASGVRAEQLVLWGGLIPPELDLAAWAERLQGAAITIVAGDQDEYVTTKVVAAEGERLSSSGVKFSAMRYDGGHVIERAALEELAAGFSGK